MSRRVSLRDKITNYSLSSASSFVSISRPDNHHALDGACTGFTEPLKPTTHNCSSPSLISLRVLFPLSAMFTHSLLLLFSLSSVHPPGRGSPGFAGNPNWAVSLSSRRPSLCYSVLYRKPAASVKRNGGNKLLSSHQSKPL